MTRVIIQPSLGNKVALKHWEDTILAEVDFQDPARSAVLSADEIAQLEFYHPEGSANFWGAVARHDSKMGTLQPGDVVLFTGKKKVQAIGEVGATFRNADFADTLWNADPEAGSYQNVYSLRNLELTDLPYSDIHQLVGYSSNDNFMGLRFLDEAKSAAILSGLRINRIADPDEDAQAEVKVLEKLHEWGLVSGEAFNVGESTVTTPARTYVMRRGEAELVRAYVASVGVENTRTRFAFGWTDLTLDRGEQGVELIEAKSSIARSKIREAVGQLLDYGQNIPGITCLSILVPERPSETVANFVKQCGIDVVYFNGPDFERLEAPDSARSKVLTMVGSD